jgi:uncharacterized protein YabE (DUF348 family)/3D (Asp-Asp-Asp) domain-containing protein
LTPRPSRLRRLRIQRATQFATVAVGVLLLAGVVHLAVMKDVTLVVDGRMEAVRTSSQNVQELLVGEGIALSSDLLVQPSPATELADGMTVVVSPAPGAPVLSDATVDTAPTDVGVWVVAGTGSASAGTVGSSDPASGSGPSSVVSVRAVVSGKVHDVSTNADTAGELLSAMGITPDANDRVQPSPSTPLHDGSVIRFDQVDVLTRLEPQRLPFRTITTFDPSMVPGTQRVVQRGRSGVGRATYQVRFLDGLPVSRRLIARWVERAPVPERVISGPASMFAGSTEEVPGAVGHTQTGLATWYDPPWSGLTAAHPWLPFGTRVTVTDVDTGRSVTVVVDDRGPFSPGKIIDLSPEAFAALSPLGHGVLHVRLSW